MKYSEYLQFKEILDENGIDFNDYIKDPILYEGIIGTIGKGLWNLAKKGMARAVSAGITPAYKDKLNKKGEEIKDWAIKEIKSATNDEKHGLYNMIKITTSEQTTDGAKRTAGREISRFINKNVDIKVRRVNKNLQKSTLIDEDTKDALEDYWETLATQIKMAIVDELNTINILPDDSSQEMIDALKEIGKLGGNNNNNKK